MRKRIVVALGSCVFLCMLSSCIKIRSVSLSDALSAFTSFKIVKPNRISNLNTQRDDLVLGSVVKGGSIFFFAHNGVGVKLYSYDGTTLTQRSNINPTGNDRNWFDGIHLINNVIYFTAYDTEGRIKFYKYADGDPMITQPFIETNTTQTGAILPLQKLWSEIEPPTFAQRGDDTEFPSQFNPAYMGGALYFPAFNGTQYEVYKYVPGNSSAIAISNIGRASERTYFSMPVITGVSGAVLSFIQKDSNGDPQLYHYSDGDPILEIADSQGILDLGMDYYSSLPAGINHGSYTYFTGPAGQRFLYRYQADDAAPEQISDTTLSSGDDNTSDFVAAFGKIYFSAHDTTGDQTIFEYTPGGAVATLPISNPCGAACARAVRPMGEIGGEFYFNGKDANGNLKIYKTTLGNTASTVQAFTVNSTLGDDQPIHLTMVGDVLYFVAFRGTVSRSFNGYNETESGYYKIYRYDPANDVAPVVISNTSGNATQTDDPSNLLSYNGSLFFTALNGVGQRHLYKHTPGISGVITAADALTNTSSGGDDSVSGVYVSGSDLFFGGMDSLGNYQEFQYTGSVVQEADALTPGSSGIQDEQEGRGYIVINNQKAWFAGGGPFGPSVFAFDLKMKMDHLFANMMNYFSLPSAFAAPANYLKYLNNGDPTYHYVRIRSNGGPNQYVKLCTMFGMGTMANSDGAALMTGVYTPGTDLCGIVYQKPDEDYLSIPFPDLNRGFSDYGNSDGSAAIWNDPQHKITYISGGLMRTPHSISRSKLYEYQNGQLTKEIAFSTSGSDVPQNLVRSSKGVYFTIDDCGGQEGILSYGSYASCRHVYYYGD